MAAGNSETITVRTRPGASVTITVTYPSGSTDNGGTKNGSGTADSSGQFIDTWTVSGNAKSGTADVSVMVEDAGQSAEGSGTFRIYHPNYGETCP